MDHTHQHGSALWQQAIALVIVGVFLVTQGGRNCGPRFLGDAAVVGKYVKQIHESLYNDGRDPMDVDVYDVLKAFNVTCPAIQHALKKLLCPGQRGAKDAMQDLIEARFSIDRAMQLLKAEQIAAKRRKSK